MPSPLRRPAVQRSAALAAAVLGIAGGGHAIGAVSGVELVLPEHTRATPAGTPGLHQARVRWREPVFTPAPGTVDVIQLLTLPVSGGPLIVRTANPPFTEHVLVAADGSRLATTLLACQIPGALVPAVTCLIRTDAVSATAVTRLDGTAPTASVALAGGAPFTNVRDVPLEITASDPLIGGVAGTSSGVTQYVVDVDGNGTFPCDGLVVGGAAPDRTGCARAFAAGSVVTVPEGDGVKTVGVMVGDGARDAEPPCAPRPTVVPCLALLGQPLLGNASAPATDTIVLDTAPPSASPTLSATSVRAGAAVSFDSALSSDPNPGTGSGIDPAATAWDFGDGTSATGASVAHTYGRAGTFTGSLTVRDRAGNVSAPAAFTVSVSPVPVSAPAAAVTPARSVFRVTRLTRSVRVVRGRLVGSVTVRGVTAAGVVRMTVRRLPAGRRVILSRRVRAGAFAATFRLPAGLTPGRFRIRVLAPGGAVARDLTVPLGVARR